VNIRPLLALLLAVSTIFAADAKRPNVVVLLADDQGWGDLSINGNTNISTPNIDSLGKKGAVLERFLVCPVCSPTRAEFLTGRWHPRGGVWNVSTGGERLNLSEKTIADTFTAAGYKTAAFGKWHNGMQYPYHPRGRGFGEYYGFCSGHWGDYFDAPLEHNGVLVKGAGYIADDFTNHAIAFIAENRERPFFCYVPYNTPHFPAQAPDKFFAPFADADLKMRARNPKQEDLTDTRGSLAMTANLDWNVGRVLHRLDELKLAEGTIVVYFSDNGPNTWRWNGGMKGKKGATDEGGVRASFFIRWPGKIAEGKRVPQIASVTDLLPTLADLCDIKVVSTKPLDGKSLKPLLLGDSKVKWPDRMIFSHWAGKVSVRTQQYRLDTAGHLFDMAADPAQDHDVAKEHPEITARLAKAAADYRANVLPGLHNNELLPFTVGYPEFPITQLPARDGIGHGGVKRSAKAPNCSFFMNWTNKEDSITWDIQVATAGKYEAVVYYTCPKADVGSKVELSFNGSRTEATVSEAFDPPLYGKEHDRAPRKTESYVKDFKPLPLGTLDIKPGRGLLTLKALNVPGKQVMDVRMIFLTLKK
jgi:arylsulfatase A-like enzyme